MDITGLSSLSSALAQAKTGDSLAILVLKKAMDIEAASAMQMLELIGQSTNNPPNLGNNVDLSA